MCPRCVGPEGLTRDGRQVHHCISICAVRRKQHPTDVLSANELAVLVAAAAAVVAAVGEVLLLLVSLMPVLSLVLSLLLLLSLVLSLYPP